MNSCVDMGVIGNELGDSGEEDGHPGVTSSENKRSDQKKGQGESQEG